MEGGKREEAGQSSEKSFFVVDGDDQGEDVERNEIIGDFVPAPPVPLKDQLEKDKVFMVSLNSISDLHSTCLI